MSESVQTAAFSGGELRVISAGNASRDIVLALPFSRLLVRLVRIPMGCDSTAEEFCAPLLKEMSPFPDDELTVSCETVREAGGEKVVFAAAVPESAVSDVADALDAAKLNVTRIDALPFGMVRALWPQLGVSSADTTRQLLLARTEDDLSLFVLDGDQPVAVRSLGLDCELAREVTLCLLEAEEFGGARELSRIAVVGFDAEAEFDGLSVFAPIVRLDGVSLEESLNGVAARTTEPGCLNALPESWRMVLEETRFKAKLRYHLAIAGGIWAFVMLVLFGVPLVFNFLTDHQKSLIQEHARSYRAVSEMRDKVKLVRKYSDHSTGALEVMRIVSENLPVDNDDMVLTSWDFKREEGVRLSGESDEQSWIYDFKDNLSNCGLFNQVDSPSLRQVKGRYSFTIDCRFEAVEDGQ